ncbi:MAG: helix-turn-helix transcriptional regulator, partial [Eubacteriales bacterium]|nr:helix-turn-helix transcriptional regulator [Eubacteriales bacterium]
HGSLADVCAFVSGEALSVYDTLRRDLIDYVNENFRDPALCRALVADRFSISVYTLSRVFKSQTGIGFKEYILARRLEYACGRLADSSDSIAEIAAQSGFSDPDYFARLFRASYGMTPSQYRTSRDSVPSEN